MQRVAGGKHDRTPYMLDADKKKMTGGLSCRHADAKCVAGKHDYSPYMLDADKIHAGGLSCHFRHVFYKRAVFRVSWCNGMDRRSNTYCPCLGDDSSRRMPDQTGRYNVWKYASTPPTVPTPQTWPNRGRGWSLPKSSRPLHVFNNIAQHG